MTNKIQLSALLEDIVSIPRQSDVKITGLALDSRLVKPGDLFFAYQGSKLNGNRFISDALKKGAVAVLTDDDQKMEDIHAPIIFISHLPKKIGEIAGRFFNNPSKKMKMIGITGTNGKTSCSHFIAAALDQLAMPCGVIGTLGNGMYGDIKPTSLTTPDVITLQETLQELLEEGAKAVSMEVSSHSLDQCRVNGIKYEIAVFTNLTRDHLDYHETMENYGAAKRKLFTEARSKFAVINADDEFGKELIESLSHQRIFAYSVNKNISLPGTVPLIVAESIHLDADGISARVSTPWGEGNLRAPLLGQFNLSNLLAVVGVLCLLRIPLPLALNCLSLLKPVPGRMQTLGGGNQPLVVVDYAHTPDALEKVLITLRQHCKGKLYCLFGCGGDRDPGKRPLMAKIAEHYADVVMVTDDNPRTENPTKIINDIMEGFAEPKKIIVQHDRSKAIKDIIQSASAGDCVLVAGKGAETYQQIGNEKFEFSDIEKVNGSLI